MTAFTGVFLPQVWGCVAKFQVCDGMDGNLGVFSSKHAEKHSRPLRLCSKVIDQGSGTSVWSNHSFIVATVEIRVHTTAHQSTYRYALSSRNQIVDESDNQMFLLLFFFLFFCGTKYGAGVASAYSICWLDSIALPFPTLDLSTHACDHLRKRHASRGAVTAATASSSDHRYLLKLI